MIKKVIQRIPILGDRATRLYWRLMAPAPAPVNFTNSGEYWEDRYKAGGNSGGGSYGRLAKFKAEIINGFVTEHHVRSVIELGCGDGSQLMMANYPMYVGFDVSRSIVEKCRQRFAGESTKSFKLVSEYSDEQADLALSLDVIYHLVEDTVFEGYMGTLFKASRRYVIVYSSNTEKNPKNWTYIRHRKFTDWIERNVPDWKLMRSIPNRYPDNGDYHDTSFADFHIFHHPRPQAE